MAITQRLNLIIGASAGQAEAAFGKLRGGFLGLGQSARSSGQQMGLVNQQMRALGTTMKYMFAGGAVYGTINMVRNLSQFQQQLGLIAAIGGSAGFKSLQAGPGLDRFSNQLLGAATDTIQSYQSMNDAAINFLSTVQAGKGVPESSIVPSLEAISKAATLSQTPVEDVTKAVTTMNVAFGRVNSTRNIQDFAAKWYTLISQAPGGVSAAPQLINQMGSLASASRLAHVAPGQMMALLLDTLRFGIPPSQAGQGLAYLLRSVATPEAGGTVKSAKQIFASLGITNDFVQQQGGLAAIYKIFQTAKTAGVRGNLRRASRTALANIGDPNFDPNNIADLGLSGQGINILAGVFRRQHALRTAIALYSLWSSGTMQEDLKKLGDSQQAYQKQLSDFKDAWNRFAAQSPLAKAGIALQGIQLQVSKGLNPILNLFTGALPWMQKQMLRHPGVTQDISTATFALMAGLGLNKILGSPLGRIPGMRRIRILRSLLGATSGAAQLGLQAKTMEDLLKGEAGRGLQDGSPERPFYVVVLGSLSAPPGAGGGGDNGPGGFKFPAIIGRVARSRWAKVGVGITGAAVLGDQLMNEIMAQQHGMWNAAQVNRVLGAGSKHQFFKGGQLMWDAMGHAFLISPQTHGQFRKLNQQEFQTVHRQLLGQGWQQSQESVAKRLHMNMTNLQRLERQAFGKDFEKTLTSGNDKLLAQIQDQGLGGLTLDLTIMQDGKKVSKSRVHLDPSQFSGGKTPGSRGRKKVMKVTPHA